ncbi:juvenile hormone acid O-methyltransferase-like [Amblyomma americanum]
MQDSQGTDHTEQKKSDLDPESFTWLKVLSYKENLKALESTRFRQPASDQHQYLDIGCGPGNFLMEHLLPRLRPYRRFVGTDISRDMIEYARTRYGTQDVSFELLDIDHGNPQAIVDKYGPFERAYSFLTFHYVWDLDRAYRNIHRLLGDGGECLVVYFTRTGITDVWHRLYQDEEWRRYMPNLAEMFAERYCMDEPVPEKELVARERSAVAAAGLDMVACRTYSSIWTFPSVDACLKTYVPFFKLDARVPAQRRGAFWEDWRRALREGSTTTASGGIALTYEIILAHSRKAGAAA